MSGIKISNLPVSTTPLSGSEIVPLVQGGVTKRATVAQIGTVTATGSTTARTLPDRFADVVNVKNFGASGDNITNDTTSVYNAIAFIQSLSFKPRLYFPAGIYKIEGGALQTILTGQTICGDGARASILTPFGTAPLFKIHGSVSGGRSADVTICDIGIDAVNMISDYAISVDFAQNVRFQNVLLANPYNAISVRQAGNVVFRDVWVDGVRGPIGVYAYASNAARNGQNDQIDVLVFDNVIVQSTYVPGDGAATTDLVILDGRVHTVQLDGLRLLSAKRGIVTQNTPGLAANFVPRFITGTALEIERMWEEGANFQFLADFWVDNLFVAGSDSADGVKIGSAVYGWRVNKGSVSSNWLNGIYVSNATDVDISNMTVYNNSLVGASIKSGVYVAGSGTIQISGGFIGKNYSVPSYTEKQKHGVALDAGFSGTILLKNVDLRGNDTAALYDNGTSSVYSEVSACPGYNPVGTSLVTPGASPWTYVAGLTRENVNIYGGSGVVVTVGGVALANQTPCSVVLQPRQTAVISYVTTPTVAISKA